MERLVRIEIMGGTNQNLLSKNRNVVKNKNFWIKNGFEIFAKSRNFDLKSNFWGPVSGTT